MGWDLSSGEVICDKLESQQRTIEMFSRKIKELEAKVYQQQVIYNTLIDGAAQDTNRINELEAKLSQQQFNNAHNLSIDQTVADRIIELEAKLENFITDEPRVKMLEDTVDILKKKLAEAKEWGYQLADKIELMNTIKRDVDEKLKVAVEALDESENIINGFRSSREIGKYRYEQRLLKPKKISEG